MSNALSMFYLILILTLIQIQKVTSKISKHLTKSFNKHLLIDTEQT